MERDLIRRPLLIVALALAIFGGSVAAQSAQAYTSTSPTVHRYQTGKDVRALQWLLQGHQLRRHCSCTTDGLPVGFQIRSFRYSLNGRYGLRTVAAVKNAKYKLGFPTTLVNGNRAGPRFFDILEGKRPRPTKWRITAGNRIRFAAAHPPVGDRVKAMVTDARYLIAHPWMVSYTQGASRFTIIRHRLHRPPSMVDAHGLRYTLYEDCSSSVSGLMWWAAGGSPANPHPTAIQDPNGFGWASSGIGYTGTLATHGRIVWRRGQSLALIHAGDLVFYGYYPFHHVTMGLGDGRVFSQGTQSGPFNLPALYRTDAVYARRYVG